MNKFRILTINPGSTSTKIGFFDGEEKVFSTTVEHETNRLKEFAEISDQYEYRRDTVMKELEENNIKLNDIDAVVGRGGGLMPLEGGTYFINDILLEHARRGANGVQHPANLGPQLAWAFSKEYKIPAFVVNPPDTDELHDIARITGVKGVFRNVHLHALNQKETAVRHAKSISKQYEDCNFVVCHIGGGISIAAHQKGKMVDGNDIVGGEGPMTPTRCGAIPVSEVIKLCAASSDLKEVKKLCTKTGGFVSHLDTADALEVIKKKNDGDRYSTLIWDTMIYQISKDIGAMATVLHGDVDAILLGGGMVRDKELVEKLTSYCKWIAPVVAYPGEFELEAMAAGATRVLNGEEAAKEYTGKPIWNKSMIE